MFYQHLTNLTAGRNDRKHPKHLNPKWEVLPSGAIQTDNWVKINSKKK